MLIQTTLQSSDASIKHRDFASLGKFLILFLIIYSNSASIFALPADTIVVYDYVRVVDTIWVRKNQAKLEELNPISDEMLCCNCPSMNDDTLFLSLNPNDTTYSGSKQFGRFGSPKLSVRGGLSILWPKSNSYYQRSFFVADHYGVDLKVPMTQNNFAFSVGYEQHGYILTFEASSTSSNSTGQVNLSTPDSRVGKYHSFPVQVSYQFNRFSLFAGYEFKMVLLEASLSDSTLPQYNWNEHALIAGFEYRLNYSLSLMGKFYTGGVMNNQPDFSSNRVISKTSSELSLKYFLPWNLDRLSLGAMNKKQRRPPF